MTSLFEPVIVNEDEKEFAELKTIIKKKIDFNCDEYKQAHLKRRLAVRLRANHSKSYKEYATTLLYDEEEPLKLKEALTVNVTELFRNPETFETFSVTVLPELIKEKGEDRTIRVWSAGCANGEEPYSIAIMLLEFLRNQAKRYNISIIGTDIDDDSLKLAQFGTYKSKQLEKISRERLDRFFIKMGDCYQVIDDVRNIVLFRHHDMISDPLLYGFDIIKKNQINSYTIEDFTSNLRDKLTRLKEGKILIYVLDSFDALTSEAEIKRDKEKGVKGTYNLEKQKNLGAFFRLRAKEIKNKNCILIIISQVRENIGVMFGPKYYRTGGKALDHWASLIVWLAEVERHRKKNLVYGITTKCRVTKVGNDKPFRENFLEIIFDYGVDNITGNILYLYNLYTEVGGKRKKKIEDELFSWEDQEYSLKALVEHIEKNNQEELLTQKVIEKWEKIENSISSKNRKSKWAI